MGKKLSSSTLSTYYQMFPVFSLAASPRDSKQFCLHFENYRSGNGRKAGTVEPRFNDLRYNDQQSFAGPTKITVKCMGHKPGITIFPV